MSVHGPAIDRLQRLRRFEGVAREFWDQFGDALADLTGASRVALLTRVSADEGRPWQVLAARRGPVQPDDSALAESAVAEGVAERADAGGRRAAVPLKTGDPQRVCAVVLVFARDMETSRFQAAVGAVQLAADVPETFQAFRQLTQSRADLVDFSGALDLLTLLRGRAHFVEAAMTVCGELAARHGCAQVALGWLRGRYVRVEAVSQRESYDRNAEAVQRMEAAMEEALDQDDEIVWPSPEGLRVTRDHERCGRVLGAMHLATIPLRLGGRLLGALLLHRQQATFSAADLQALRVLADQIAEPLELLRRRDRWWGARLQADFTDWCRARWSLEHPWAKLAAVVGATVLLIAFIGRTDYRVEATFVLRPADQVLLGAPFDGYLKSSAVVPGDTVAPDAELFALDDTSLRLQEASLRADVGRNRAEAERARGAGRWPELRIAQAQEQQAAAELELVRHHLASAVARAPFAGIVLDDADMRDRLGAPLKRGDSLIKLARADRLYAELDVAERDIDEIARGATGEVSFASRPDLELRVRVERIEPIAVARQSGGVFVVRAELSGAPPDWARPGMTGLAKINAGRRTWFWIASHRLVDWLRMKFWW